MKPVLWMVALLTVLLTGCSNGPVLNPEATIKAYEEARNHHDFDMVMRHVADHARFEDDDREAAYLVDEYRDRLGWDMKLHVTSEFRLPVVEADTVVAIVTETNDLRRALGAGKEVYRARYIVHKGKIVYRHTSPLTTEGTSLAEVLPAFLDWVREHHADELDRIVADGELVHTRAAAGVLADLLPAYTAELEQQP